MPTSTSTRIVTVTTRTAGQSFGTVGVVKDARTGRKIVECDTTRPYGFTAAALDDARALAARKGWTVRDAE